MSNIITQYPKSSVVIASSSLIAFSSIITAIVNCIKPEATKSLVNFFGGEKGFALAATLIASTFLAIAAAGIACIAVGHSKNKEKKSLEEKKDKEIKNLKNNPINKIIDKIKNIDRIELTLNKEDLSVTGDLDKLIFDDDESEVITKNSEVLILTEEEKDNEASYKVTGYKEKYGESSIEDVETIKDKLFNENSEESKNITVFNLDEFNQFSCNVVEIAFSNVIEFK